MTIQSAKQFCSMIEAVQEKVRGHHRITKQISKPCATDAAARSTLRGSKMREDDELALDKEFHRAHALALAKQEGWCRGYEAGKKKALEEAAKVLDERIRDYKAQHEGWRATFGPDAAQPYSDEIITLRELAQAIRSLSADPIEATPSDAHGVEPCKPER